ncbi:MAG: hypothetical protein OEW58_07435 [Gammaproteobacteria bacterium]|nr:hypothetical protein [Gammaproteobacteria bacterium]
MRKTVLFTAALLSMGSVCAEEDLDDLLGSFDTPTLQAAPPAETSINQASGFPRHDFNSRLTLLATHNYQAHSDTPDYQDLSSAKTSLRLGIKSQWNKAWRSEAQLAGFHDAGYAIKGRDQFNAETLKHHEQELELRDTFVQGKLSDRLDIKIGRQIVVWGKSDSLRVVDVLNPLDLRDPGITDIENLRLPVGMAKADYYQGSWHGELILVGETRFSKRPAFGSQYSFYPSAPPAEDSLDSDAEHLQYAAALHFQSSAADASLHLAKIYDDDPYMTSGRLRHAPINLAGISANAPLGAWLVKTELALTDGKRFSPQPKQTYQQAKAMLGLEYYGISNHTFALEAMASQILDYDQALDNGSFAVGETASQTALRYSGKLLREQLTVNALASLWGNGGDGAFYRGWSSYELASGSSVSAGVVIYQSGDQLMFKQVADRDKLFVSWDWYY